jgi:uncharacterized protein (TIGR02246 family)
MLSEKLKSNRFQKSGKIYFLPLLLLIIACNNQSHKKGDNIMNEKDYEDIYKTTESFMESWNKGDAKAAASFYTEDAVRVGAMGDVQHNREEITAAYENLMHKAMPGAKAKQEKGTIRMLTTDLAVWQGGLEIRKPDGSPPMKGHVVQVMKKIYDKWMILEAHPKFFPPAK